MSGFVPPSPQPYQPIANQYGINFYGNTGGVAGWLPQPGFSISDNGRGLLEGTAILVYQVNAALPRMPPVVPKRGSDHPTDGRLKCSKVDASFNALGDCRVTASYVGLAQDPTIPEIELTGSTSETSIVFHPNFPNMAIKVPGTPAKGGKPAKPAVYHDWVETDNGNFVRFKIGAAPEDLGGVEAYLTPRCTVRVSYYTGRTNLVKGVQGGLGLASESPGSFPSALLPSTGANWLLTSVSISEYGVIYKISEEWMLSESGKPWNKLIYGETGGGGGGTGMDGKPLGNYKTWTGIKWGKL